MSKEIHITLLILVIISAMSLVVHSSSSQSSTLSSPVNTDQQLVTYQKQSNFIHEFDVPNLGGKGLKGIVTDSIGNPWFYHQTNKTSTIIKFNLLNKTFISYPVYGVTTTDNPVINLAGGQLIYDKKRSNIWFTDARVNALGSINTESGRIELYKIPTNNSGIMGLVLSPDNNSIWFTEIIANNIGSFDIGSKTFTEYPTGESTGPTLLTYDSKDQLWVTMSYSSSILKVEPWSLVPGSRIGGMFDIKLEKPDTFSPFGVAIANTNISKLYVSDHGSSRVVASNQSSEMKNYTSYWTSPSVGYPVSLPSQVASDEFGNVYFLEHGGNKIAKISNDGLLTEFDIPTGPLATVVYLTVSSDAAKIWFTEWASNKIGYLDNTLAVPLDLKIMNTLPTILKSNQTYAVELLARRIDNRTNTAISLNGIEVSIIGMTESGLQGLFYLAKPQRFNLTDTAGMNGKMNISIGKEAIAGKYTIMERISTPEKDNLIVSLSLPQTIKLDVPIQKDQLQKLPTESNEGSSNETLVFLRDLARYASIGVAISLIGYLVYRKIKQRRPT